MTTPRSYYYYLPLVEDETEVRREVIRRRYHSEEVAESGFTLRCDSKDWGLTTHILAQGLQTEVSPGTANHHKLGLRPIGGLIPRLRRDC